MDKKPWSICPSNDCSSTLHVEAHTYWEIDMRCPRCPTKVILKRYISGHFKDVFCPHSELSKSQKEFLKG